MNSDTRLQSTTEVVKAYEDGLDPRLMRWGGVAGLAGVAFLLGAGLVVEILGLPDASDVETLTDFADIEPGRIAEHFLYLGALVGFGLHLSVLHRILRTTHPAAALFGAVVAGSGLVIMAAGSLLHVSTSPLAELYSKPDTPATDRVAIEYAWHGAQSVFDTMLATGVLLVPIGILFIWVAMRSSRAFGSRVTTLAFLLGVLGIIGAAIAVIQPGSMASAAAVLAIAVFHLSTGVRTLQLASRPSIDLTHAT